MSVDAHVRIADYFRHYANIAGTGDPVEDVLLAMLLFAMMGGFVFALVPLWFLVWTLTSERTRTFGIFSLVAYTAPVLLLIVLGILDLGRYLNETLILSVLGLCWIAAFVGSLAGLVKLAFSRPSNF